VIKNWAESLIAQCREPKNELRRRRRIWGNVLEDVCRLLAPLL
jgi:hypothetical protein